MGASGLLGHLLNDEIDFLILAVMGSTSMVGGYIGSIYTNRFSPETLKLLIGIALVVVAIVMFLKAAYT
jgi:uncharacterized protein